MIYIDDAAIKDSDIELIHPFGKRQITHVIHDVDGTHSLIREWRPAMSICMHWAMTGGLKPDFDSPDNTQRLIRNTGKKPLPETDRYCIECNGFSAITQLEYAIRRAIEDNTLSTSVDLNKQALTNNSIIIKRIWSGQETSPDIQEPKILTDYLKEITPRMFKQYEAVLNGACRDKNLEDARNNPHKWQVPGSKEFLEYLHQLGCINHFVTGAVIYQGGGMHQELEVLGYPVGPDQAVKSLQGSAWDNKLPKDEVIAKLFKSKKIDPTKVLVVGDGRTEMKTGVELGCVTISRLDKNDTRQRQIHADFGVNLILADYTHPLIKHMIYAT